MQLLIRRHKQSYLKNFKRATWITHPEEPRGATLSMRRARARWAGGLKGGLCGPVTSVSGPIWTLPPSDKSAYRRFCISCLVWLQVRGSPVVLPRTLVLVLRLAGRERRESTLRAVGTEEWHPGVGVLSIGWLRQRRRCQRAEERTASSEECSGRIEGLNFYRSLRMFSKRGSEGLD